MINRKTWPKIRLTGQALSHRVTRLSILLLVIAGGTVGLRYVEPNTAVRSNTPIDTSSSLSTVDSEPRGDARTALASGAFYVVRMNYPVDQLSSITVIDALTGEQQLDFSARYKPTVAASPDGTIAYIVDSFLTRVLRGDLVHALTALDLQSGLVAWEIDLPGQRGPYMGDASTGLWTSVDGLFIYVLMASGQDLLEPRIVVVDASTHQVAREVSIQLPYDPREHWPRFWKLGWTDKLVITSWDQIFTVDLTTGQTDTVAALPAFDDQARLRIPKNLNQIVEVEGGAIAEQIRQLYLVTSAQDVISVDLDVTLSASKLFSLPKGWEFGLTQPVAVSADGQFIFLGVRQVDSPVHSGRFVEQVWAYDTGQWNRLGSLDPAVVNETIVQDQGVVGMALGRDGRSLYTVSPFMSAMTVIDTQSLSVVRFENWELLDVPDRTILSMIVSFSGLSNRLDDAPLK